MNNVINEVKKKRDLSGLPDNVVKRVLDGLDDDLSEEERVKEARRILRKYFGVFLTNRVIKPKDLMDYMAVLKSHKSSQKRNYEEFYERIKKGLGREVVGSVVDLGCGLNGFSYPYLRKAFGDIEYTGVEASSQVVDNTNMFFDKGGLGEICNCIHGDLFDIEFVLGVLKMAEKERLVFLFQVVDALENLEEDFSKRFLLEIKKNAEFIVVSLSMKSLSGKKKFEVRRNWITNFLKENFEFLGEEMMYFEYFLFLKC